MKAKVILFHPELSKEQAKTLNRLTNNNNGLKWDGNKGHYSDGTKVFKMYWSFNPDKPVKIKINLKGEII